MTINNHNQKEGKTMKKAILCMFVLVALVATTAWAGDKQNISEDKGVETAKGQAVDTWTTAVNLAAYGRESKNALALVVAAQMLKDAPAQSAPQEKITEGTAAKESAKEPRAALSAETLLAEASSIAADDLQLMAAVENEQKRPGKTRGDVTGPNEHGDRVRAGQNDIYNITFRGNESAEILVVGDGDTDLDLYIYDENGNLIESDTDYSDSCYVEWTPRWTGNFKVKIKNLGSVYNEYVLLTN